jgi:hypothetical protein
VNKSGRGRAPHRPGIDRARVITRSAGARPGCCRPAGGAKGLRLSLINGLTGLVWFERGQLRVAFGFTVVDAKITGVEMIADRRAWTSSTSCP